MTFIGHTGNIQRTLEAKLARVRDDIIAHAGPSLPSAGRRRQLFTGPRGVGKTELAKQLAKPDCRASPRSGLPQRPGERDH